MSDRLARAEEIFDVSKVHQVLLIVFPDGAQGA